MQVEFDAIKDAINRSKHGLSLGFAKELVWDEALTWLDDRFQDDELRMIALVPKADRLYCVAFVEHGDRYRIISLRRAKPREVRHYAESTYH